MEQLSKNGAAVGMNGFHPPAATSSSACAAPVIPSPLPFWLFASSLAAPSAAVGVPSSSSSSSFAVETVVQHANVPQLQYPLPLRTNNSQLPSSTPPIVPPTAMGRVSLLLNATSNGIADPSLFIPPSFTAPNSSCSSAATSFQQPSSLPSANSSACNNNNDFVDRIGESARNRFGRPYISGRPLLLCDRQKIIKMYREGRRKIAIAREIGVTHSCVSKVIRRFEETGMLESKNSRTASCACPGDAEGHDPRICRHARFVHMSASASSTQLPSYEMNKMAPNRRQPSQNNLPKKFSIEWILSEHCASS